ncbi:hypothetical protein Tco_0786016 [Tanacetum coccineum]
MKRPTKGYSGQEVALFHTILNVSEPSTSPSRITSSPSYSPEPSTEPSHVPSTEHSPEPSTKHSPDHTTAIVSFPSPTQPTQSSLGAAAKISNIPHDTPLPCCSLILEGRGKLSDAEVQEKASNETEPIIQEVTPTEVIQDQGNSEKGNSELEELLLTEEGVKRKGQEKQGKSIMTDPDPNRKNRPIFEKFWDFNQHIEPMEHGSEKMKSPEKIEEEDKSLPRKSTRSTVKNKNMEEDAGKGRSQRYLDIVPKKEFTNIVESLSTKYLLVEWEDLVFCREFQYLSNPSRGDGSSKNYKILSEMLEDFDRQDVMDLHRLVKERYSASMEGQKDIFDALRDLHTLI